MTAPLDQIMKFRDFQVAEDVGKMAALGWFDTEFTMHGCGYLVGDLVHYLISSHPTTIYDFIEASVLEGLYPTPLVTLTKKCPVPSGQKEIIAQQVKIQLAEEIRSAYPREFFQQVTKLGAQVPNDGAKELLLTLQDDLTGLFVADLLQIFESLVLLAYEHKVLTPQSMGEFGAWLVDVRSDMEDDVVIKDIFERTFYGFAYEEADEIKYYSNTLKETVVGRKKEMTDEGLITTPIFCKTYWYNYTYRLDDAKTDYQTYLAQIHGPAYLELVKTILTLPPAIMGQDYQAAVAYGQNHFSPAAQQALLSYGSRWNVIAG